jgi:predicted nucleotidyltransferase
MNRGKAVQTVEEVKEILQKHKDEIAQKYKVKEIGIFGSFVRGEHKKRSDVDVLVEYYELPGLLEFIDLEIYIEKLLRKKVDLVEKEGIRPELKKRILDEVIYI